MTTDYLSIIQRTRRTPDSEPMSSHSTAMPAPPPPSAGSAADQDPLRPIRTGIKRKRLVLSCLECKRRKLKCDRELPVCKRCRDAGQPDRCKYDERIAFGDDDGQHSSSPSASLPGRASLSDASAHLGANGQPLNIHERQRLELLERHVASLESRLNIQPGASQSVLALTPPTSIKAVTPDNHVSVAEISNDPEEPMVMRGKKFKTQFYGASHSVSIISYFDEVHDFLKKTVREHPMFCNHKIQHKVRKDIERSQKKEKYKYVCIPPDRIDQHLLDLLPDQATCRHYMEIYFKHFEGLYRIIHRVVFWRQFDKFWSRRMDNAAPFTALLLVAMSCARCLFPDTPLSFEADSTTSRVQAVSWVHAAETWHTYQSKKHTFLENFQVACLILLSKRVNAIKLKQHYAIAQAQAAIAISAGLHRSPYLLGPRNSLYDREMRRRIWAVVAEQELSCSNGRGIPSTLGNIFSDCEAPHNLRDDEFDEETETPPAAAAPDDVFTEMSYTRWMHDVRPLRMTINALVNHPQKHHALSYSELLSYHTQITTRLSTLPRWSLPSNAPQADLDRRWFFERMMELNLHHLLIILHLPYAADRAGGPNAAHSRFICNESARITLSVYEDMPAHGFSGMCITRHHIVRSGLVTCLLQDPIAASSPLTSPLLHTQSTTLLEKAFSLIEDRILCLGSGFRGYWLLFAASCFLKSHGTSPEGCAEWQRKITERIIAIFGKICMSQVSEGTPGFSLADAAETAELYKRHVRGADWRDVGEEGMGARAQWERDGFGGALARRGSTGGAGPAGGAGVGAGAQTVDGAGAAVGAAAEGSAGGMGGAVAQTDMGSGGSTWMGSNGGLGVGVGEIDWADWTLDDFGFYSLGDA